MNFFMDANILDLDRVYCAGVASTAIYVVVYLPFRFIGILVHLAPINHSDNAKINCVSDVLAVLVTLILFNLVFIVSATVSMTAV